MSAAVLQPAAGEGRLASFDWRQVESDLDAQGSALLPGLLTPEECAAIAGLYPREDGFRSRVVMGRHGFGRGEYKYFAYPLPEIVHGLRPALYARLVPTANRWHERLGSGAQYQYPHDFPGHWVKQEYMPPEVKGRRYYIPSDQGQELKLRERRKLRGIIDP